MRNEHWLVLLDSQREALMSFFKQSNWNSRVFEFPVSLMLLFLQHK